MPTETITPRQTESAATFANSLPRPKPFVRAAWWLWPHLFSLDAPVVALTWQQWWAHTAGVQLSCLHGVILGSGVWLIYLADRLADTSPHASGGHETARHAFYQRHRRAVQPVAVVLFLGLAWLAPWYLSPRRFLAGLGLLALAGIHFWATHRLSCRNWPRILPKEAVVGGMFTAGTAFFVLGGTGQFGREFHAALCLFGVLCFFNCALITKWERNSRDVREPASLLNAFPRLTARLNMACLLLATFAGIAAATFPHGRVFAPIALGALLLAGLDWQRDRLSADARRVLADAVLLTPWLFLFKSS